MHFPARERLCGGIEKEMNKCEQNKIKHTRFFCRLGEVQDLSLTPKAEGAQGVRFDTREYKEIFSCKCTLSSPMCFHHSAM